MNAVISGLLTNGTHHFVVHTLDGKEARVLCAEARLEQKTGDRDVLTWMDNDDNYHVVRVEHIVRIVMSVHD